MWFRRRAGKITDVLRVGLTGGIGAGKSTVARVFADLGAVVVDADRIAREVVAPGSAGLAELVAAFGPEIVTADGDLDRPALAAKAFASDEARTTLNGITHPRIGARTAELIAAAPREAIVVQDVPLLVEGGMAPIFHLVVVVDADVETRVARLVEYRGLTEDDARARIRAQASTAERRAVADVWFDNSGTPEALIPQVRRLWEERIAPYNANILAGVAASAPAAATGVRPAWPTAGDRLVGRLWVALGADAANVVATGPDPDAPALDVVEAQVVLAPNVTEADVVERLAAAGFIGDEGVYLGADPGQATRVIVERN